MANATYTYFYTLFNSGNQYSVASNTTDLSGDQSATVTEPGTTTGTFDNGEAVTVSGTTAPANLFYRGTVTFNGVNYPVFATSENGTGNKTDFYVGSATALSGTSGSAITTTNTSPVCMLAGTLISTPNGPQAIESLSPGDSINTFEGEAKVRFISSTIHHPTVLAWSGSLPIRISAGAFGPAAPLRDLLVSPDHAVLIDGHLVQASALVNGSTITSTTMEEWQHTDSIHYYNVELEQHAIIEAEGLSVESYIDNVPRKTWDNYDAYLDLYGVDEPMAELALPRIKFSRQLPSALKLKLEALAPATKRELVAV